MTFHMPLSLQSLLQDEVVSRAKLAASGHTMRIDDVPSTLIPILVGAVRAEVTGHHVYEMNEAGQVNGLRINSDKAVEIRNAIAAKDHPYNGQRLLLFVAPGIDIANPELSSAGSSTGNSFEQIHISELIQEIIEELEGSLSKDGLSSLLRSLTTAFPHLSRTEAWASFLAELSQDKGKSLGRNLWRIGLVPDLGDSSELRIQQNIAAVKAISYPSRPGLTLTQRLQQAGMRVDATSAGIASYLSDQRGLERPETWCEKILLDHAHELTFEKWPLKLHVASSIESVTIKSFRKPDGTLDRSSKLLLTENDELICKVDPENGGRLVLKWATKPALTDSVARWHFQVVYPSDLRHEDSAPIAEHSVKGSSRTATIAINVNDDDLVQGTKFVVRLTATDEDGQSITLESGELVDVESDEFDVILSDEVSEQDIRKANAATLPEAVLRAVEDGLEQIEHDSGRWDSKTQVFSIKLSPRRQTQILVSRLSAHLQRAIQESEPSRGKIYTANARAMSELDLETIEEISFDLPDALSKRRRDFLSILKVQSPRNLVEVANWSEELSTAANEYVAAYRRAIDNCEDSDLRRQLLQLDSFTLSATHSGEDFAATIVLPIHPLRLAWFKAHSELLLGWAAELLEKPRNARKNHLDLGLVSRVTPANLPFAILDAGAVPSIYFDDLSVGTGIYFPIGLNDLEMKFRLILDILGLERVAVSGAATARQILARINAYSDSHDTQDSLSMLVVNPGEGRTLSSVLRQRSVTSVGDDLRWKGHVQVTAYSEKASFSRPIADLQRLQSDIKSARTDEIAIPFIPLLGLSSRGMDDLLSDEEPVHIGLMHGLISNELTSVPSRIERASSLRGLISPLAMVVREESGETVISSYPALQVRGSQAADEITSTHKAQQSALGQHLSVGDTIGITSHIDPTALAQLGTVHARSDWVISIDRHLGASLYDLNFVTPEGRPFLLDYAPDFIDGIGDRITVTTSKRREVDRLLKRALEDMDMYGQNHEPEEILDALARLSGRLALRLSTNTTQASEAVGLAVLMMHLEDRGNLEDTIVVPLDSHPEIFGHSVDDARTRPLRCDIMLVRLTGRSFRVELVEVKNRRGIILPRVLSDHIGEQLRETEKVLVERYFESDGGRLDSELQWSKLTSLLHFYADRAFHLGQVKFEKLAELHKLIDRLEESRQAPEITKRGYVISLMGKQGFPEFSGDIPIAVLTQQELGQIGMTTLLEARDHERSALESSVSDQNTPFVNAPREEPGENGEVAGGKTSDAVASTHAIEADIDVPPVAVEDTDATDEVDSDGDEDGGSKPKPKPTPEPPAPPANLEAGGTPGSVTIKLGHDAGSNVATWRISTEGSPHAFILGIPGQGKSVTTRRIMRDLAEQNLPTLVFDFHGDMAAAPPEGMQVFDASKGLPFSPFELLQGKHYAHAAYEIREILAIVGSLGEIQGNTVYRALLKCYEASGFTKEADGTRLPTIAEFVEMLEIEEEIAKSKNARARLTPLTDFDLFDEHSDESFQIREGKGMVIDLSQLGIEAVQMAAGSFILRKIYKEMFAWDQDHTMKLAIVLDEAHRLAKDVTLPKIMKEGRKYGIAVIVASQGLEDFSPQVISNAGTKIAFRCNFPSSRKVGGLMRGPKNVELSEKIENLQVGQAYVSTPEHTEAQKIYMFGDDD
jgi:DNA phosphorothioation-dependent restriction protein DptH